MIEILFAFVVCCVFVVVVTLLLFVCSFVCSFVRVCCESVGCSFAIAVIELELLPQTACEVHILT